jgi:hypothetical protein
MFLSPDLGLVVEPLDKGLELSSVYSPYTPAPDLYGRELAGANEGVSLRHADVEVDRDVLIVLMTSALVVAIWGVARERLVEIVSSALSSVCGGIGC